MRTALTSVLESSESRFPSASVTPALSSPPHVAELPAVVGLSTTAGTPCLPHWEHQGKAEPVNQVRCKSQTNIKGIGTAQGQSTEVWNINFFLALPVPRSCDTDADKSAPPRTTACISIEWVRSLCVCLFYLVLALLCSLSLGLDAR